MSYAEPFKGLKVVDLSQGVAGPYCAMMLAQYGANVLKVEPTDTGDWSRALGTIYGDHTAYSIPANLGKRSIALDLKSDEGKALLWKTIEGADVFLQGFRPGVIDRLGFGYAAVAAREPRILYVSISGFGLTGPLSERPAMDPVLQAYTGLMAENRGDDGIPHRIPIISIDMSTAIYAFTAVSTALFARRNETVGRHIEASLMQGGASLQVVRMMASYLDGGAPRALVAPTGIYETADGWVSITVVRPFEWTAFCKAIDRTDLGEDPRYKSSIDREPHTTDLNAILRPLLKSQPTAHWSVRMTAQRVMHEALNSYTEFLQQPHVTESGAVAWTNHPHVGQPIPLPNLIGLPPFPDGAARSVAPSKGEHSAAILREHGYSDAEIAGFVDRGVVLQAG